MTAPDTSNHTTGDEPMADKTRTHKPKATPAADAAPEIVAIKGFDAAWKCRGYQFAIGGTYEHAGPVVACESGFHAIEGHPLEVLAYYPPGTSRYAEVRLSGVLARHGDDSKVAAARLTVTAEITLPDLIDRAVRWVVDRAKPEDTQHATDDYGAASSTGDHGAASSTGDHGAASSTGDYGAASAMGDYGAASATGYRGAASSTGDHGAASSTGTFGAATSTGDHGAASSTGDHGAASATGYRGAASSTGYRGAASSTGYRGAANSTGTRAVASATGTYGAATSTGDHGAASSTGTFGAASSTGYQGRVMGATGCMLTTCYRDPTTGEILHAWAGIVGRDGIKPGVWYRLDSDGQPVEVMP